MTVCAKKIARPVAFAALLAVGASAHADVLINEVYMNAPGSTDPTVQYFELRGTPGQSLQNYYLVVVENENSGHTGEVDHVFDLGALGGGTGSIGSNGYTAVLTRNSVFATKTDPAANTYINTGSTPAFGDTGSTIGHTGVPQFEGGGGTYFLIHVDTGVAGTVAPLFLTPTDEITDLDVGDNGLDTFDASNGRAGWTIVDSIGITGEGSELDGLLYGKVNFAPGVLTNPQPGTINVNTISAQTDVPELEYFARYGTSTGFTADDWVIANLTDNAASGYTASNRLYAVSGTHATHTDPEAWNGSTPEAFAYGTAMTGTIGSANVPVPEPAALSLLGLGSLLALRRRRVSP